MALGVTSSWSKYKDIIMKPIIFEFMSGVLFCSSSLEVEHAQRLHIEGGLSVHCVVYPPTLFIGVSLGHVW